LLLATFFPWAISNAQGLSELEAQIVRSIDEEAGAATSLFERIVNINSGTFNASGVAEVGRVLEPELHALGFTTEWLSMDTVGRGPSLVARRQGSRGKRLLLIGHIDTVFETSSPFQRFVRTGNIAIGPGTGDMKGGLIVMLSALKALKSAGAMDDATITVFLTGDEESVGEPWEISRKALIGTAKASDAVLSFEPGMTQEGKDYATTARRGFTRWELRVQAKPGHSGLIFSDAIGDGAVFEISRILSLFHDSLREPHMTYNVGLILGGSNIRVQANGDASVAGKANVVPGEALAIGDIRVLTSEQLARVKANMQAIVTKGLPATKAEITFEDSPPMSATPGNAALLEKLNEANRALGGLEIEALDPMLRGAGDVSFVAPFTNVLDGLGAPGSGFHAPGESVDLSRMPLQTKRAALLIYRLLKESSP